MSPQTRKSIIAAIDAMNDDQIAKVLESLKTIQSGKPEVKTEAKKAEESKILASRMGVGRTASGCQIFRG